jgi:hypothetical protein
MLSLGSGVPARHKAKSEFRFDLKVTDALSSSFMVAKGGIEANYEVTLKWKKALLPAEVEQQLAAAKKK